MVKSTLTLEDVMPLTLAKLLTACCMAVFTPGSETNLSASSTSKARSPATSALILASWLRNGTVKFLEDSVIGVEAAAADKFLMISKSSGDISPGSFWARSMTFWALSTRYLSKSFGEALDRSAERLAIASLTLASSGSTSGSACLLVAFGIVVLIVLLASFRLVVLAKSRGSLTELKFFIKSLGRGISCCFPWRLGAKGPDPRSPQRSAVVVVLGGAVVRMGHPSVALLEPHSPDCTMVSSQGRPP
mmetsp:Transcript_48801/g.106313  ORF Transcript_48801/g.106313 Transcript_48801/m.106313 type:complete len:247 (+) Transcript_48801:654-1394(+)